MKYKLTAEEIRKIEKVLNDKQRAEVIPLKDNIKVIRLNRTEEK